MVRVCFFIPRHMQSYKSRGPDEQALLALLRRSTRLGWHHGSAEAGPEGVRLLKNGQCVGVWSHKTFGFVFRPAACSEAGLKVWSLGDAVEHSRALVSETGVVRNKTLYRRPHHLSFLACLHANWVARGQQLLASTSEAWNGGLRSKLPAQAALADRIRSDSVGTGTASIPSPQVVAGQSDRMVRFHEALQGTRGAAFPHRRDFNERGSRDPRGLISPASSRRLPLTSRRHLLRATMRLVVPPRATARAS